MCVCVRVCVCVCVCVNDKCSVETSSNYHIYSFSWSRILLTSKTLHLIMVFRRSTINENGYISKKKKKKKKKKLYMKVLS